MAKECTQCKKEIPDASVFCMFCGTLIHSKLPKCPKCKEEYTEAADFCLHCGYAITDKAKKESKRAKSRKEKELLKRMQTLEYDLSDEKKNNNKLENELKKENEALKEKNSRLEENIIKKTMDSKQYQILPKWFYFFVVGVISLCLLVLFLVIIETL